MKSLTKWMVGLDLSPFDQFLIKYTHELAQFYVPEEIVFVHIKDRVDLPANFRISVTEKFSREEALKKLESEVFAVFSDQSTVRCEVHEGTPSFDLWRETYLHHTDLFIIGEKGIKEGRKVIPEKFIKKSFCNVLLVPQVSATTFKNIWIAADLTERTEETILWALTTVNSVSEGRVTAYHVFEVPSLDVISLDLREEYVRYLENQALRKILTMAHDQQNAQFEVRAEPRRERFVADQFRLVAEKNQADLMIASSSGKKGLASLIIGSTTQRLIRDEKTIPLLILKEKIDRVRAWDIITNL